MHAPNTSRPTTPLLGRLNWRLVTALAAVALVWSAIMSEGARRSAPKAMSLTTSMLQP